MSVAAQATAPSSRGRLGRRHRLRAKRELREVLRRGKRARGRRLSVATLSAGQTWSRIGLAVSKSAGNSPQRSRIKRLLREAFAAQRNSWPLLDVVAMCRRPWPDATLQDVKEELNQLVVRGRSPKLKRGRR